MLVINQRNILASNIRSSNPVTQAKPCLSWDIWMVFPPPQQITGNIWLHIRYQRRNITEKVVMRSMLRLLAFSLQAILGVNLSFLVLPWIGQVRELHTSTLRWLSQLALALERWVKESEWESEMQRPERLHWSKELTLVSIFFLLPGEQGAKPKPVSRGETRICSELPHVQQSPCVVPIHWWAVLWRLALLHNDPVSLSRCEILTRHSTRNWTWGQCSLAMIHCNGQLSMKFLNAAARCLLLG